MLVGIALRMVVAACGLNCALDGFGAGIGEEDGVGEGQVDQTLRECLALRAAVEVRDVDQGRRLLGDRFRKVRVTVAEQVDRDARCEVQILLALLSVEIDALTSDRPHLATRVNGHERSDGHFGQVLC